MLEYEKKEIPLRRSLIADAKKTVGAVTLERLTSRLEDSHTRAVIFADEGREQGITSALRKMHVINYIPSKFGDWGDGHYTKNIRTQHIIEDPIFKKSERSYFIQLADCVAFSLLKREVSPTPLIKNMVYRKCLIRLCLEFVIFRVRQKILWES